MWWGGWCFHLFLLFVPLLFLLTQLTAIHCISYLTQIFSLLDKTIVSPIYRPDNICKCELQINTEMIKYFQWKMMSGINLMQWSGILGNKLQLAFQLARERGRTQRLHSAFKLLPVCLGKEHKSVLSFCLWRFGDSSFFVMGIEFQIQRKINPFS